jgi:hypothetical protein
MKILRLHKGLLFGLVGLLCSNIANAGFVYTDWKSNGDQKVVLHQDTGIEWLRLVNTRGQSIADVRSQLATVYLGWRLPSVAEVNALMIGVYNAGNNIFASSQLIYATSGVMFNGANMFIDLLGDGVKASAHHLGLVLRDDGSVGYSGAYRGSTDSYSYSTGLSNSYTDTTRLGNYYNFGVFLVSNGGTTLSSIQNPLINASNPAAPVNNVPVGGLMFSLMGALLLSIRRRAVI